MGKAHCGKWEPPAKGKYALAVILEDGCSLWGWSKWNTEAWMSWPAFEGKEEDRTREIIAHHGPVEFLGLPSLPPARQRQRRFQSFWKNDNWQSPHEVIIIL